jgi:hypothetical protein
MSKRHPNNGATFTKGKLLRGHRDAPNPARQKAAQDQMARNCAKTREFREDPEAWVRKYISKKSA